MFIPPFPIKDNFGTPPGTFDGVGLQSHHLVVPAAVATQIFGESRNAHVVYYAERRTLLVASGDDTLFTQLHKARKCMLKDKNARGDKSIALHDILLDNQVASLDRELEYQIDTGLSILQIQL